MRLIKAVVGLWSAVSVIGVPLQQIAGKRADRALIEAKVEAKVNVLTGNSAASRPIAVVDGFAFEKSTGSSNGFNNNFEDTFVPINCVAFKKSGEFPPKGSGGNWKSGAKEDHPYFGLDTYLAEKGGDDISTLKSIGTWLDKAPHADGSRFRGNVFDGGWRDTLLQTVFGKSAGTEFGDWLAENEENSFIHIKVMNFCGRFRNLNEMKASYKLGWPSGSKKVFEEGDLRTVKDHFDGLGLTAATHVTVESTAASKTEALVEANDFLVTEGATLSNWAGAKKAIEISLQCVAVSAPVSHKKFDSMPNTCKRALGISEGSDDGVEDSNEDADGDDGDDK